MAAQSDLWVIYLAILATCSCALTLNTLAKGKPTIGSLAAIVAMAAQSDLWVIYLAILATCSCGGGSSSLDLFPGGSSFLISLMSLELYPNTSNRLEEPKFMFRLQLVERQINKID